jgi:hypothetical protein
LEARMAEPKTTPNDGDVVAFLNQVENEAKRQDCFAILELMRQATGEQPIMWGDAIIGFGSYHYRYASGREGDSPLVGFSPRKQNITIYITSGFEQYESLLNRLGKHSTAKSCLYLKKLDDVDTTILAELVKHSAEHMRATKQ